MPSRKKIRRRKSSRKKKRLNSVKKLLKSEEFRDLIVRIVREIIRASK